MPEKDKTMASRPVRLSLSDSVALFLLEDESVVYSRKSRQLYGLDRTATAIMFRLEQGESAAAIALDLGLTTEESLPVQELAAILAGSEKEAPEYPNDLPCPLKPAQTVVGAVCFRLLETVFTVEGPDELLLTWIIPFLAAVRNDGVNEVDLLVAVEAVNDCWQLFMNGAAQGEPVPADRLLPLLHCRLRIFAYQRRQYLLAVHGTVLSAAGGTIILAGSSGSGKSTLAAVLLRRGYFLVSDEPVVITAGDNSLLSMPLGLGLKNGSWPILLPEYPQLEQLPVHVRFDGQKIRYLLSGTVPVAPNNCGYPADKIIFTRYSPEVTGKLEQLTIVQTLNLILEAGYQVPGLDEERVLGIINWLNSIGRYALAYPSTGEALLLLEGLTEKPAATAIRSDDLYAG